MNTPAPTATAWWVEVNVGEVDGVFTANAVLHTRDRTRLEARGTARLNPHDPDVPEIGYDLATARALSISPTGCWRPPSTTSRE